MLILRRDKTFSRRLMTPSVASSTQSMTTTTPCALPSLRTRRRVCPRKSRLLKISWKLLEDSRALLEKLRSLLEPLLPLTTPLRPLMPGRMLLLLSSRTMDLQEDIAAKLEILKANAKTEQDLLPQGDKVPADAQAFKDELKRITDYVLKLQGDTKIECDKYSNDVKYWAEYRTGIKEFNPWLASAEKSASEGLSKPSSLDEVKALD